VAALVRHASRSVLLAVAASVIAVPSALATITVGRGIAGVRLGDTQGQVYKALGKPNRIAPPAWVYNRGLDGRVAFDGRRRARSVSTRSSHQRTSRGVAPGASLQSVHTAYPRAHCFGHPGASTGALCLARSRYRGHTVETDFVFSLRLTEVDIYFV
jgi:hypothetical protein